MAIFIRKNIVTFSFVFTANDGSFTQPSGVKVHLKYKDLSCIDHEETIDLSQSGSAWIGAWDSSASGDNTVHWMVYGYGTLQAAAQGEFVVSANPANDI